MADKCVKKHFINTAVNYKAACDELVDKKMPECSLQRLSVYVETKKSLIKNFEIFRAGIKKLLTNSMLSLKKPLLTN